MSGGVLIGRGTAMPASAGAVGEAGPCPYASAMHNVI
jgi:hypothetical protein